MKKLNGEYKYTLYLFQLVNKRLLIRRKVRLGFDNDLSKRLRKIIQALYFYGI